RRAEREPAARAHQERVGHRQHDRPGPGRHAVVERAVRRRAGRRPDPGDRRLPPVDPGPVDQGQGQRLPEPDQVMIRHLAVLALAPSFTKGILTVISAFVLFVGSPYLLASAVLGLRMGYLVVATSLFAWMIIFASIWTFG